MRSMMIDAVQQRLLDPEATFATLCQSLDMDARLRKGVARLGYVRPTLVQSRCLPLAISSGRDLLVRARTGSGKTLAYLLPILHKVLRHHQQPQQQEDDKNDDKDEDKKDEEQDFVQAVVLVPTRELCHQVHDVLRRLCYYCDDVVNVAVLTTTTNTNTKDSSNNAAAQQEQSLLEAALRDRPDVVVSTPAGLVKQLRRRSLRLSHSVSMLVVDEADLVLSFGYADDVREIVRALPKICQGFLLSATLSPAVEALKRVVLHAPAVLQLEEEDEGDDGGGSTAANLVQYHVTLPSKDKVLLIYVFLKLGLLKGKGLFFVNTTDAGYRLKLFLEQFHIRSAVLNAELPARSRMSIIDQFNADNFDYLIATDESAKMRNNAARRSRGNRPKQEEEEEDDEATLREEEAKLGTIDDADTSTITTTTNTTTTTETKKRQLSRSKPKHKKDSEYGVSRGMDFRHVSFVLNVDIPLDAASYTHRIGRTARGGAKGVALTLLDRDNPAEKIILDALQRSQPTRANLLLAQHDDTNPLSTASTTTATQALHQLQPSPLEFDLTELEGFRYRVEDVGRAVSRVAVREARAAELRAELLNSEKLTEVLDERSLHLLRHDRTVTAHVQRHLKHVPFYLLPKGREVSNVSSNGRRRRNQRYRQRRLLLQNQPQYGSGAKTDDPLQPDSFADEEGYYGDDGAAGEDGFFGDDDNDNNDKPKKKPKTNSTTTESKVFLNTRDGTGESTAGNQAWKKKHGKGKFNKRNNKVDAKWT